MKCWRAPGKIILFGEHFVVKGRPALVTAVDRYATACIEEGGEGYTIEAVDLGLTADLSGEVPIELKPYKRIYELVTEKAGKLAFFRASIRSDVPVGAGMGSSAATAVAFTAALLEHAGLEVSRELVNSIAYEAEKITHGNPSGIDNTAATYGGLIYYRKPYAKPLDIKLPEKTVLVAVDTGILRNTKTLVGKVLARYDRYKDIMERIYEAAEKIVEEALKAMRAGDLERLGELFELNHGLLVSIGVSNKTIEEIRYRMLEYGALGAKITGAGGGGLVIGIIDEESVGGLLGRLRSWGRKKVFVLKPDENGVVNCNVKQEFNNE